METLDELTAALPSYFSAKGTVELLVDSLT
jgi:hypothetical protein